MKKTILTCLVLMAIGLCLFVSCNAEQVLPDLEDGVAYIKFGDNSRGLSPSYEAAKYKDLYWFYTASKDDNYGTTGATSTETAVKTTTDSTTPNKGLDIDGYLGPFSQGDWIFNLYAYKELNGDGSSPEETTLIYSAKNIEYTLKSGESRSIPVTVNPEGSEGTVEFNNANFVYETSGKAAPTLTLVAESTENVGSDRVTYTFSTEKNADNNDDNYYQLELKSSNNKIYSISFKDSSTTEAKLKVREDGQATYKCNVTVTIPNGKDSFTELTNTFYFGVYSGGATTTISGNLLEDPEAYWKFDVAEYVLKTVDYNALIAEKGVEVGNATMSFANAKGLDQNATYTLKVTEKDSATLKDDFVINSGSDDNNSIQKVYNLSLVDTTTGKEKTDFKQDDGGYVTVSLFAGTGLNGNSDYYKSSNAPSGHSHAKSSSAETTSTTTCTVTVRYNGTESQPEVVSYCAESGYVTITTEHFSEFVVIDTSKLPVSVTYTASDTSETKYYTSLKGAFEAINNSNASSISMELINNVTLSDAITVTKSVALNLKKNEVKVNGGYISVGEDAELTVSNVETGQSNFVIGTIGESGKYTHAVASTVCGGKTTYQNTLEAAVKAANEATAATTINILEDIKITEQISVSTTYPITLDLGGNTINGDGDRVFLVEKGELTVKNGTLKAKVKANGQDSIGSSVIRVSSEAGKTKLVLSGDARIIGENCYGITAFATKDEYESTIDIYGAITSANPCVGGNGSGTNKVTINIYSGASLTQDSSDKGWTDSTTNNDPVAIYQPNDGELNIYGGTITSVNGSAVEIRAGKANISGGELVTKSAYACPNPNGNGPTTAGAAVAVSQHSTKKAIEVSITGGTFSGAKKLAVVNTLTKAENIEASKSVKVTVPDTVIADTDIDGIKVGDDTYYPTLEAAVSNAQSGKTIKLLNDVDLTYYTGNVNKKENVCNFIFNNNITLEMNNKTITSNNASVSYEGDGLTIQHGKFVSANGGSYALFIWPVACELDKKKNNITLDNLEYAGGINVVENVVTVKNIKTKVDGTEYYALYAGSSGEIIVESGNFSSTCTTGDYILYAMGDNEEGKITVKGGEFTVPAGKNLCYGNISISGGKFNVKPDTGYLESGYEAKGSDSTWTVERISEN